MFERFTSSARSLVIAAQERSHGDGDDRISARHLLLAALAAPGPLRDVLTGQGFTEERLRHPASASAGLAGADAEALRGLGIDLDEVRRAAEESFGPGALDAEPPRRRTWRERVLRSRTIGKTTGRSVRTGRTRHHLPFSAGAKQALNLSLREAMRLGSREITAEHVVLGCLAAADQDVDVAGLDLADSRRAVEGLLRSAA